MRKPSLAVLLLVAGVAAQERREPLRGSAVTEDGKPWAGAAVRLLSRPLPGDERFGCADEVVATTDAKGRFLVQLLPGRFYVAWALQDLGENRYCASLPVEELVAGRPLELIADAPRARRRVVLKGADAWAGRGAMKATVLSATSPAIVAEVTPEGGAFVLPPLPGRRAYLLLTCAGLPLFQWPAQVDPTDAGDEAVTLPRPRDVRVRVFDESKAAIAGARLSLRTIDPQGGERILDHELGHTDAKGETIVTLPLPAARFQWVNYAFGVLAPGFAPIGNIERVDIAADHDATKSDAAMLLRVPRGASHAATFVRGDAVWSGPIVLRSQFASIGNGSAIGQQVQHVRPDAAGKLSIARRPDTPVILLADAAAVACAPPAAPLHPVALLGCIAAGEAKEEIRFDVASLEPLVIHAVGPEGGPVEGARVAIVVRNDPQPMRALDALATDRGGRVAALVPKGLPMHVVAWSDGGCAVAKVDAAAPGTEPLVLRLTAVKSVPGTVTGEDGRRAAFARVVATVSAAGGDAAVLGSALQRVAASTARDGTFRMPLYPGLLYSMRGVATAGDEHFLTRHWLVGKNEPDELEFDLTRAR